ncbi:MAG TPA: hypothetical protein VJO35_05855 [Terriglobales bacterium]|nr:hypothetical protein [Terriglobales bacterium]
MPNIRVGMYLCVRAVGVILLACLALPALAQNQIPDGNLIAFTPVAVQPVIAVQPFLPQAPFPHKFWDRENRLLFATTAAMCAADFSVTHMNLSNGGRELNPLVRPFTVNSATLATNFAGQTAGVMALSYLFHRTGHHRLERLAPLANVATSAFAVTYGLSHR